MCHHPEVQKKVAAEIDQFIKANGRVPQFTERTQVPYCISVMKECMRFRPTSAFGVPHAVREDGMDLIWKSVTFFLTNFQYVCTCS